MSEQHATKPESESLEPCATATEPSPVASRFPELEEIQREVAARIKDNQRFLECFMNDDFAGADLEPGEDDGDYEEL